MNLDPESCYRALRAKDRRFDGAFFVAVASTHIYCRPICPARPVRREGCRFYRLAAEAERDGYRACLRCRPELAPGNAPMDGPSRLVARAVKAIEAYAGEEALDVEALAGKLGSSSRHLRRSMQAELGLSPIQLDQSRRLALAKQLLHDSPLSLAEIAFASGFGSVRRFNAAFAARCGMPPSRVRGTREHARTDTFSLRLDYRPPLRWDALTAFLALRATPGVEQAEGGVYRRTVALGGARGWLSVAPVEGSARLAVSLSSSLAPVVRPVVARPRRLFDLDAEPSRISEQLSADPVLTPFREGLRVPGAFDGFELGIRAILGQQVSVRGASTLCGRLAERFGAPVETPHPGLTRIFPTAERIAGQPERALAEVGLPSARAATLRAFAVAVRDDTLRLEPGAEVEATLEALKRLPGVGDWTAHYIAMRALGWPDAFPYSDLGLRKALGGVAPKEVLRRAEAWRPWRAYAAMQLWSALDGGGR
jgi:AraC family transcriptional regulator of adaptative response / DNA-3-methyladenine glycosylase II